MEWTTGRFHAFCVYRYEKPFMFNIKNKKIMNKGKIVLKLACLAGYLLFASLSGYFTATSLSLNLLNGTNLWFIFVLVLVISILAGWCLTNVIVEMKKHVGASRSKFAFNFLGFLLFWLFSFTTNVHYFFVEKHGYTILTKELASAKQYIVDNTAKTNKGIDDQQNAARMAIDATVRTNIDLFGREIMNTMNGHLGFGEACISIIKSTESSLRSNSKMYGDSNDYTIFDEKQDAGDKGVTQRTRLEGLYEKYKNRMEGQLNKKLSVIDNYYERQKDQNSELTELLDTISILETRHLPAVLKDGSVASFYRYNDQQNGRVIAKMPKEYGKYAQKTKVYPSGRMFDTMSVWGDVFNGRLGDMTMLQWIIIAFICDLVAFILFAFFRDYDTI